MAQRIASVLVVSCGLASRVLAVRSGDLDPTLAYQGVVRQPDGRLVVAGDAGGYAAGAFVLARYLADGTLDSSFGTGGTTSFGDSVGGGRALLLQPDGRVVVAGRGRVAFIAGGSSMGSLFEGPLTVFRLESNGTL